MRKSDRGRNENISGTYTTTDCLSYCKEGIYLTGGSTRLPYIDNYLASYTGFAFNLSDLYETSAVHGLEKIIHDRELRRWAQPVKQKKL